MRQDAQFILQHAIRAVLPDAAVQRAMLNLPDCRGRRVLVAVGKAAARMAQAALQVLPHPVEAGIVITKYGHGLPMPPQIACYEAGHPVPDENSFAAARAALELVQPLGPADQVLFLLSGGGSALFEQPLIDPLELADLTQQLLHCGAEIRQINTIRKRLSGVKGGRFALRCAPAQVYTVVLSDIVGDPLDMIASGPACPDSTTCADALAIVRQYGLHLSLQAMQCLQQETPKILSNVTTQITGSVRHLCAAGADACRKLGYEPVILTDSLQMEAAEAGRWLAQQMLERKRPGKWAFLAGGETVVHVTGSGLGGRNQELALSAAEEIAGLAGAAVFSFGSDGTDGPTDAAGGYVDGTTREKLGRQGLEIPAVLRQNDSYHALKACGGLLVTGPTGTNVNDLSVALWRELD